MCEQLFQELQTSQNVEDRLRALDMFRKGLRNRSDGKALAKELIAFLDGGRDVRLGAWFKIDADGHVTLAPSLRTALLDELGRASREDAASYARRILEGSHIPEEWTLALRDWGLHLGTEAAQSSGEYKRWVVRHLERKEWLDTPTEGYLHGFDAGVYVGGAEVVSALANAHDQVKTKPVQFAARMALDRIAMKDYVTVASQLINDPQALASAPVQRGLLLARADPRSEQHMELVHSALTQPRSKPEEAQTFLRTFPHADIVASPNLMTRNQYPLMGDIARRDVEAHKQLDRFGQLISQEMKVEIESAKDRLRIMIRAAEKAGQIEPVNGN
ncbi:MAG: hypothetical protein JNJ83_17970 [Verrucomicrobiaceae bacterium]|nr:hypothetical protein [Verrucomicrobiaceae bacterium]